MIERMMVVRYCFEFLIYFHSKNIWKPAKMMKYPSHHHLVSRKLKLNTLLKISKNIILTRIIFLPLLSTSLPGVSAIFVFSTPNNLLKTTSNPNVNKIIIKTIAKNFTLFHKPLLRIYIFANKLGAYLIFR